MRSRIIAGISTVAALVAVVVLPWLAWREAQRQAFETAADMTQAHARAVLYRAEKTAAQANAALNRLARFKGEPCSAQAQEAMRAIDLTSTYIQAVAHVRDGVVVCSSMGALPLALGEASLRNARGLAIYPRVSVPVPGGAPLIAAARGGFVVLMHRDLPLDISVVVPGVALAALHLDAQGGRAPDLARGAVERSWVTRLDGARQVSFIDGGRLVAVVRSARFRLAAVAAVPVGYLEERTRAIAWRLVPAAALAGWRSRGPCWRSAGASARWARPCAWRCGATSSISSTSRSSTWRADAVSASKRCCAGTGRAANRSAPTCSSRWPNRPASSRA